MEESTIFNSGRYSIDQNRVSINKIHVHSIHHGGDSFIKHVDGQKMCIFCGEYVDIDIFREHVAECNGAQYTFPTPSCNESIDDVPSYFQSHMNDTNEDSDEEFATPTAPSPIIVSLLLLHHQINLILMIISSMKILQ
jgi:hypothetical protein